MLFFTPSQKKKTVKQADSKPAIYRIWLQRGKSGIKRFLVEDSPPLPQAPAQNRRPLQMDTFLLNSRDAGCKVLKSTPVCVCTHTQVFSKPAVEVYCFPSPQLAVKHLIQQLWPSANSAVRTLSAPSLGRDTRKKPARDLNDLPWCILRLRFSSLSPQCWLPAVTSISRRWKKFCLITWDFPGMNKTPPHYSYMQGLPPHLVV